ncbi:hypothetical protein COCMIDRAFT_108863 [Bipolaris oryzae ATCC 44560]|uniref:Cryptic loci regulator 2 N-terminal domain-containing protein n=1 Tax=Bipolaris oryzae ATCC 44560 TaxID=930090 RepID=W6Z9N4_COCMI|nr:uncharacterized protein COCMIDRAFT_108863 [Bipolaris oryzae ATCC 44560]EUC40416.1 hypothetical protein COCMIDRAFT_108863 [Bipolaris oryzae ATCC 44560]
MTTGRLVRLKPGCSDGDPLHVPASGTHTKIDPPTLYLEKIAQLWMEQRGSAQPRVKYILEALPSGYTMWQRPRPSDPKCFDKYLFGHPSHKKFDSPNRFYPHFEYLMHNDGNSIGCPCTVCRGPPRAMSNSSRPRSSASSRSSNVSASASFSSRPNSAHRVQPTPAPAPPLVIISQPTAQGRPKKLGPGLDMTRTDQDGTPDVYRNLVEKLRSHKCIDQPIQEPLSPDWRAEQENIPKLLQTLKSQDQWIPRNGDIIMFIRHLADGVTVVRHGVTNELCLYDEEMNEFLDVPRWEAGLVTEVAQTPTITDLLESTKNANGSCSGMRVELIPNPNNPDKSLSKRYKYISLRQSRPLFLWKELLQHVDQDLWHPSIKNALALTSTLSLVGKHRFRGTWPEATIYCHGIFVGSEMLAVGDTVRLLPTKSGQAVCTDIMSIKSIRLKWSGLDKASTNDYDEGRPFNSAIWLYGSAYTSDASRSDKRWASDAGPQIPRAAEGYGDFYPLHPPDKELAIPYARVAGRLHERNAMAHLLGYEPDDVTSLNLDLGRQALIDARAFSRRNDERIAQTADATWYWGDDRAEALGLRTINGLDVSRFNQEHDVKALRKQYRILDAAHASENEDVKPSLDNALGGRLQRFMAPTLPVRAATPREFSQNNHDGKKRGRVIDLEDDSEDEIRQHTQVVDNRVPSVKKAKVMVVID